MRLFYSPGSCSLASHVALAESKLEYEITRVDLKKGEQDALSYRTINPLGRVPALEDDGRLITENIAILNHIADKVADQVLLPPWLSPERIQAIEWMGFLSSTLHPNFRAVNRPEWYVPADADPAIVAAVRSRGLRNISDLLLIAEQRLGTSTYCLGDRFSLCDPYLLVFLIWGRRETIVTALPDTPSLDALARRLWRRPSVAKALQEEGLGDLAPWGSRAG